MLQLGDVTTLVEFPDGKTQPMNEFLSDTFGYDYSFRGGVIGILIVFMAFFAGMSVLAFTFLKYQKR